MNTRTVRRKTTLDQQRENFEKAQSLSLVKATGQQEIPVKEKHVRKVIIGTYQEKNGHLLWNNIMKLPVQVSPIVAWKFFHVIHKVLRDGHSRVLMDSQRFRGFIEDLGRYWAHMKEGYGKLISLYSQLMIRKLNFHGKNPHFPGNLFVTDDNLEKIAQNDINNYFEMSVDMLDYTDDILALQGGIFNSLDMSRSNSMTYAGQCRLAPLILCIQDSSQLYDYIVKILFKLHASLPGDTLTGHRDRFNKQFKILREFYISSKSLQYFKNLIQVPLLPEHPPNFLIASELSSHVTPVVRLPPEEPDDKDEPEFTDSLIDTSEPETESTTNGTISSEVLFEKERFIEILLREVNELRTEVGRLKSDHQQRMEEVQERIHAMELSLAQKDSQLSHEISAKQDLVRQLAQQAAVAIPTEKLTEAEKKAQDANEKFTKLKDVYQKLREEHISLLRNKADIARRLDESKKTYEEMQSAQEELHKQIAEHESLKLQEKYDGLEAELNALKAEKQQSDSQFLQIKTESDQKVEEIKTLTLSSDALTVKNAQLTQDLKDGRTNMIGSCCQQAETQLKKAIGETENPLYLTVSCSPDYLISHLEPGEQELRVLQEAYKLYKENNSCDQLIKALMGVAGSMSGLVLYSKAASHVSPDIEKGDQCAESGKTVGEEMIKLMKMLQQPSSGDSELDAAFDSVGTSIRALGCHAETLRTLTKGASPEKVEVMVEDELTRMDAAIEAATKKIEELLYHSRKEDTGIKLEVNEKLLDSCTGLMNAVRILVQKSKKLQDEIVKAGKGTASAKEFYKRNHRWTEGLISAAKAVGLAAKFLVDAADKVVGGSAKLEEVIVASQEIAASTVQLVVASRVKADRGSNNLIELFGASKGVSQATGNVVATAKSCSKMIEEKDVYDFEGLSLHAAKRLEMESQVKVLEFESSLEKERAKLSKLRRHHYQLAGEMEGWEESQIPAP